MYVELQAALNEWCSRRVPTPVVDERTDISFITTIDKSKRNEKVTQVHIQDVIVSLDLPHTLPVADVRTPGSID